MPGRRSLLDAHLCRGLHPWLRTLPRDDGRADPGDMGTPCRAAGDLPYPALPRRQAPFKEVASSGLALWGGDGVGELKNHLLSRASGGPSWGAQPLRTGGSPPLGVDCRYSHSPAAPLMHDRLGFEPGVALPPFWGRRARADQVDSLRRFGGRSALPDYNG